MMKLTLHTVFAAVFAIAGSLDAAGQPANSAAGEPIAPLDGRKLKLAAANVLVYDANATQAIYSKGADIVTPIASVTKLMTAMVVLDAVQPRDGMLTVGIADLDCRKGTPSPLRR